VTRAATSYLVVPARGVGIGIDASRVTRIVAAAEWSGEAPRDVLETVGLPAAPAGEPRRVLLFRSGAREVPLAAAGKLSVRTVEDLLVQPLPAAVLTRRTARLLGGIVLAEDETPMLVLGDVA
jgi:hypothetical protein